MAEKSCSQSCNYLPIHKLTYIIYMPFNLKKFFLIIWGLFVLLTFQNCQYKSQNEDYKNNEEIVFEETWLPYSKELELKAESGDSEAQAQLGHAYRDGIGIKENEEKARYWFQKSADQNYAKGYYGLYLTEKKAKDAIEWLMKAVELEYPTAIADLGVLYMNGWGIEKDGNKAFKYNKIAAEKGVAQGELNLGVCYEYGIGTNQDFREAVKWFRKAANKGVPDAENSLGVCYKDGKGVEQDYKAAFEWFQKAAEHGNILAYGNLGCCYLFGNGVDKNFSQAYNWLLKSAENGDAESQFNLGIGYYKGDWNNGIPDFEEARKWIKLSASNGCNEAQRFVIDY